MGENSKSYRFGDLAVDLAARELRRGASVVDLQPKVYDLIVFLLENRHRAVSKEELQEAVWPGVIVTEAALTRAVMKARKSLGDDAEKQSVIKTVHGHGYRFVADVVQLPPQPPQEPAPEPAMTGPGQGPEQLSHPGSGGRQRWPGVLAVTALLAIVLAGGVFLFKPSSPGGLRIAVLPVRDFTEDPEMSWVSLGLMSLIKRVIADSTTIPTVSARRLMELEDQPDKSGGSPGLSLAPGLLKSLREDDAASHIVLAALSRTVDAFELSYTVYHPRGMTPEKTLSGADAAGLAQEMTREILSTLPGSGRELQFRPISDDPFVTRAYARRLALQMQGEVREARDFFEVAVREDSTLFWPRYELALTTRRLGELEQARGEFEALIPMARQQPHADAEVAVRNALAQVFWLQGDLDTAETQYREALRLAQEAGNLEDQPTMMINLAILDRNRGKLTEARELLSRALDTADRAGVDLGGYPYQTLGLIAQQEGNLAQAESYLQQALEAFQRADRRRETATSMNALAGLYRRQGKWDLARSRFEQVMALRRELEDRTGELETMLSVAALENSRGNLAGFRERAAEANALAETLGLPVHQSQAMRMLGTYALENGNIAEARQQYSAARELARIDQNTAREIPYLVAGAKMDMAEGKLAQAETALQELLDYANQEQRGDLQAALLGELGELERQRDNPDAAEDYYDRALEAAWEHSAPVRQGTLLIKLSDLLLDQGLPEQAIVHVVSLTDLHPQWPRTAALRARLAHARGEDGAAELMKSAREQAGSGWGTEEESWFREVVGEFSDPAG